jgi:hypothetical protein
MQRIVLATLLLAMASMQGCLRPRRASPAALIRLTKAVQSEIAYVRTNTPVTDERLLQTVYTQDPELRVELGRFSIHTKRDGSNVVILVCSPDGKKGVLEDASWTLKVDRQWHKTDKKHPCAFDPTLGPPNPEPAATVK